MDNSTIAREIMDGLARADKAPLFDAMRDDVRWRWMGSAFLDVVFDGKHAVVHDLWGSVDASLSQPYRVETHTIVADGDHVVVEHSGHNTTTEGRRYDNRYCWVLDFADGQIIQVREYMDTLLVAGTFPGPA